MTQEQADKMVEPLREMLQELRAKKHAEMLPLLERRDATPHYDRDRAHFSRRLAEIERAYAEADAALVRQIAKVYSLLPCPVFIVPSEEAAEDADRRPSR
jgi:hypothetical protein